MANNKSTIKQIPLNMSINMNKNQSLVDSSWSMVNKINSPVYGGTITNIHAKTVATGDAIWDKKGERYYIENNILKSTNSKWNDIDLTDKYTFTKESLNESLDGICKHNSIYYGFKQNNNGNVDIYSGSDIDNLEKISDAIEPLEDYVIQKSRIVALNNVAAQYQKELPILLTVQEKATLNKDSTNESDKSLKLVVYDTNGTVDIIVPLYLGVASTSGTRNNKTRVEYAKNKTGTGADRTSQTSGNNYQIIVSSVDFSTDNLIREKGKFFLGISVLSHRMKGENNLTSLKYDNVILHYWPDYTWLYNGDFDKNRVTAVSSSLGTSVTLNKWQAFNTKRLYTYTLNGETKFGKFDNDSKSDTSITWADLPEVDLGRTGEFTNISCYPFATLYNDSRLDLDDSSRIRYFGNSGYVQEEVAYTSDSATAVSTSRTYVDSGVNDFGHCRNNAIFLDDTPYVVATDTRKDSDIVCFLGQIASSTASINGTSLNALMGIDPCEFWDEGLSYAQLTDWATSTHTCMVAGKTRTSTASCSSGITCGYHEPSKHLDYTPAPPIKDGAQCLTTNQRYHRLLWYGRGWADDQKNISNVASGLWDSATPTNVYGNVGIQSTQTVPTTKSAWEVFHKNSTTNDDYVCYNSQGSIAKILDTNWRLLINYKEGIITGISYGEDNKLGKLVTEWDTIDENFFIYAEKDFVIYRNIKNGIVYKITRKPIIEEDEPLKCFQIIDDRYLIGNIDIERNCFDIVTSKYNNWANDWNNRVFTGFKYVTFSSTWWDRAADFTNREDYRGKSRYQVNRLWKTIKIDGKDKWVNAGTIGSGQNISYTTNKTFAPSRIDAYQTYIGFITGYETFIYGNSLDGIDLYTAKSATTPTYNSTIIERDGNTFMEVKSSMSGKTYPVASGATSYYNMPIVGVDFIESYNGKFAVRLDDTVYGIIYNGVRPIGLYNTASLTDDIDEFFIVQGQYYAVVNGYIAAVYYSSSGALNNIEQIIDVNGMKFIGAFPSVAYFWAPSTQSIYAFTGDADLQLFVQSNRIETVYNYLYDPASEWILLNTNDGLYVMTQINVYKTTRIHDVSDFFSTDDGYIVVIWDSDKKNTKLGLRKWETDWITIPVELSTAFYSIGDTKKSVVDCWYIRLYRNDEDYNGIVTLRTDTLNDIVVKGKEKTEKLTKDKWDINDNCLIRFQPNNQHSLGTSLNIVSDYPIVSIMASVTEDAAVQSKVNI